MQAAFLEKFVLPVLVGVFVFLLLSAAGLSLRQRGFFALAVLFAALGVMDYLAEKRERKEVLDLDRGNVGILVVHVADPQDRPIAGVVLSTKGDGSTGPPTSLAGKTRIRLAPQTRPNNSVSLQVVRAPKDFVFLSPWDSRVRVPPFENESENFVQVVLAERGDRALLENGKALATLASRINAANAPKAITEVVTEEQRRAARGEVAREFGLEPDEVHRAIRDWGQKAKDPYEKGLSALYEENYPEASRELSESLRLRESELQKAQVDMVHAAFFLGVALYKQGKYAQSVVAYRKAAALRQDDSVILNILGLSLTQAGEYTEAEPVYRRSLAIAEKAQGPEHPNVAASLNNLGELYRTQGKHAEAEPLFRQALAIWEKALGPEEPAVAVTLNNLAALYRAQGKYAEAEPLYQRAISIDEKTLGPEHPGLASDLNNLGELHRAQGKYAEAEPLYRRALAIDEKALGPDHPDVATDINNLALLYLEQGQYAEAEPLHKRALAIWEKALGPRHPSVAISLNNLALLYRAQGKYTEAEPLFRRSLAIWEKALGPEHPNVATALGNYAKLLRKTKRDAEAAKLEARAQAIRAKHALKNPKK